MMQHTDLYNCSLLRGLNHLIIRIAVANFCRARVSINFSRTDSCAAKRGGRCACGRHKFQSLTKCKWFILRAPTTRIKVLPGMSNRDRNALIKTFVFRIMRALSSIRKHRAGSERELFTDRGSLSTGLHVTFAPACARARAYVCIDYMHITFPRNLL